MAQSENWKSKSVVVCAGHRLVVFPRNGDDWQSQWSVVELWHATKSDEPLCLSAQSKERQRLRISTALETYWH